MGDKSGAHGPPEDEEGREVLRQLQVLRHHRREDIYPICGNHDRGTPGETDARWWRDMVLANPDSMIITAHHYVPKNTTVASRPWEGMRQNEDGQWCSHYPGFQALGTPSGASYLYWVGGVPDSGAFEEFLGRNSGAVDLWLAGHTHTHPEDTYGGKSHIETRWKTHFINVAALTRHHVERTTIPMSRRLTFQDGSDKVRVQCFLHTSQFVPQRWYPPAERILPLSRPFSLV